MGSLIRPSLCFALFLFSASGSSYLPCATAQVPTSSSGSSTGSSTGSQAQEAPGSVQSAPPSGLTTKEIPVLAVSNCLKDTDDSDRMAQCLVQQFPEFALSADPIETYLAGGDEDDWSNEVVPRDPPSDKPSSPPTDNQTAKLPEFCEKAGIDSNGQPYKGYLETIHKFKEFLSKHPVESIDRKTLQNWIDSCSVPAFRCDAETLLNLIAFQALFDKIDGYPFVDPERKDNKIDAYELWSIEAYYRRLIEGCRPQDSTPAQKNKKCCLCTISKDEADKCNAVNDMGIVGGVRNFFRDQCTQLPFCKWSKDLYGEVRCEYKGYDLCVNQFNKCDETAVADDLEILKPSFSLPPRFAGCSLIKDWHFGHSNELFMEGCFPSRLSVCLNSSPACKRYEFDNRGCATFAGKDGKPDPKAAALYLQKLLEKYGASNIIFTVTGNQDLAQAREGINDFCRQTPLTISLQIVEGLCFDPKFSAALCSDMLKQRCMVKGQRMLCQRDLDSLEFETLVCPAKDAYWR